MSPIARNVIKFAQRIKDPVKRNATLALVEEATKRADLAHFTVAKINHTDKKEHATVLLATAEQDAQNRSQPVHIYPDENGKYRGHALYDERENKDSD